METGLLLVPIAIGIGVVLFVIALTMRYKEAKEIEEQNAKVEERNARAIERWAAREARRAR